MTNEALRIERGILIIGVCDGSVIVMLVVDEASVFRSKLIFCNLEGMADTRICAYDLFHRNPYINVVWAFNCSPVKQFRNSISFINLENQSGLGYIFEFTRSDVSIE